MYAYDLGVVVRWRVVYIRRSSYRERWSGSRQRTCRDSTGLWWMVLAGCWAKERRFFVVCAAATTSGDVRSHQVAIYKIRATIIRKHLFIFQDDETFYSTDFP
jgi:hypothetical protein